MIGRRGDHQRPRTPREASLERIEDGQVEFPSNLRAAGVVGLEPGELHAADVAEIAQPPATHRAESNDKDPHQSTSSLLKRGNTGLTAGPFRYASIGAPSSSTSRMHANACAATSTVRCTSASP